MFLKYETGLSCPNIKHYIITKILINVDLQRWVENFIIIAMAMEIALVFVRIIQFIAAH